MNKYAEYIRILGRGPTKSRHLTREEAQDAFSGVLSGDMSDMQIGAFLLLLRYRSEDAGELAGIVEAIRESLGGRGADYQDMIDWPSYAAGRSRGLPWFLLSAKLLSENGVKIFMHGFNSHLENGIATEDCLCAIGEKPCASLEEAQDRLARGNFAFLPLRNFCLKLEELLQVRSVLGVRSIINTAVRLVNPLRANTLFLGIFHPAYIDLNLKGAALLGQPQLGVIKGGAGEAERSAVKKIKLFQRDGETAWAPLSDKTLSTQSPVTVEHLKDVWQGKSEDAEGAAKIIGTVAMALYLYGRAKTPEEAEKMAQNYWDSRLA